ncbi:MAG: hypothetical protein RLZZ58_57 [Pseudomonadota bacterium]
MTKIADQRHRFAMPRDVHYFNCGYMGPLPDVVSAAVAAGAARKQTPWTYAPTDFFAQIEAFRTRAATLVGTAADNIAIVPSVSYALATAARNLPVARGQSIVVLGDQFPSNFYVWQDMAAAAGGDIRVARRDPDDDWTAATLDAITADTAIVAVPHCHWADGRRVDLVAVGTACRTVGAALVIDATQSLGAMPLDLDAVRPDFMVAACYKWLLSPYGTAIFYVDPRHHAGAAIEQSWLNRAGSQDFARLVDYQSDFQPGARRFDMGECANPPLLMGAGAAFDLICAWGIANIAETLEAKTGAIADAAAARGLLPTPAAVRAGHFLSLGFDGAPPAGLVERLAAANVHVSLRGQSLRITPHLYNNDTDVAALLDALTD